MTSIKQKIGSLAVVTLSTVSTLGSIAPATQIFAQENKTEVADKQADVAQVTAKATIEDSRPRELGVGNTFSQGYTLNLTVPDTVKAGSIVNIKVENLPLLFGSGDVKSADVSVDGTVIGKISLKKSATFRSQQIDSKTTLDQNKAANI